MSTAEPPGAEAPEPVAADRENLPQPEDGEEEERPPGYDPEATDWTVQNWREELDEDEVPWEVDVGRARMAAAAPLCLALGVALFALWAQATLALGAVLGLAGVILMILTRDGEPRNWFSVRQTRERVEDAGWPRVVVPLTLLVSYLAYVVVCLRLFTLAMWLVQR